MSRAANILVRGRYVVVAAWLLVTAAAMVLPAPDPADTEPPSLLPPGAPSQRTVAALAERFPGRVGLSQVVVAIERRDDPATEAVEGLAPADLSALERIADRITDPAAGTLGPDAADLEVMSPASLGPLREALVSPAEPGVGQAALLTVQVPASFVTTRASQVVEHVQHVVDAVPLPAGLTMAVTGSASYGHDYAVAAQRSYASTMWVTVIALIVILLALYRAPLASAVPLLAVAAAAVVATLALAVGEHLGLHIGTGERIFVYVLLFGGGVDYSLFFVARYREYLTAGEPPRRAAAHGLAGTAPAILASAGTTIAGLLMLMLADFRAFRTVGPAVAVALTIALAAALTLVPAVAAILGPRLFWPVQAELRPPRHFWPRVGRLVVRRPALTIALVLAALAAPAVQGLLVPWMYDSLADLAPGYPSVRGAAIVRRHWPVGELAPVDVLIETAEPRPVEQFETAARRLTERLRPGGVEGVSDVRSVIAPIGRRSPDLGGGLFGQIEQWAVRQAVRERYVGAQGHAMRLTVTLDAPPFSTRAMATLPRLREAIRGALAQTPLGGATVQLAGSTAEMADLKHLTGRDFTRVAVASLAVIAAIVLVLLRDWVLTGFLVLSTVVSYLATLGVTYWVFAGLFGAEGLDWKVEVFLFVVMVAVGQDYNIFLASRLAQEGRHFEPREAAERAVVATGGIISSCGVIMAASLGALMSGDLALLRQLGFALAAGILAHTFLVRPLLVPAIAVLTGRTGKAPAPRE